MGRRDVTGRLPDFLLLGAMKAGTTTLFRWLDHHPRTTLPEVKEPAFLSDDRAFARGVGWYADLFAAAAPGRVTGEASTGCTAPDRAPAAARRARRLVPRARLLCVLRDPVERARSHYRHEVQRGRERRPFPEAVAVDGNPYLERSRYTTCLGPWLAAFPRRQLLVVRSEDLFGPTDSAWLAVLDHLGLAPTARPSDSWNVTAAKPGFTRPLLLAWEHGLLDRVGAVPRPLRRAAGRVLLRRDAAYERLMDTSRAPLPPAVTAPLRRDASQLGALLGEDISWAA